jgi:hypothetical protein
VPRIKAFLVVLVLGHYHAEDIDLSFGLRGCGLGGQLQRRVKEWECDFALPVW